MIDQQPLTVCIGAKCLDGFVLIADRKLTDIYGGQPQFERKIFGDVEHILTAYAGSVAMFDMFRKYMVGDIVINRDMGDRYTFDNFISKTSTAVERFNKLKGGLFEVLIERHGLIVSLSTLLKSFINSSYSIEPIYA